MPSVPVVRRPRPAGTPPDLLGLAVALYLEAGRTEAEALCALHAGVLRRAAAQGIRLEGEAE
jgi:hypothetical protein